MLKKVLSVTSFSFLLIQPMSVFAKDFSTSELKKLLNPAGTHGKSICGSEDERRLSQSPAVGRAQQKGRLGGCTITMIGRTCAISAGHCLRALDEIHFNTGLTRNDKGDLNLPYEEDVYYVDESSTEHVFEGIGQDWAVFRVKSNELTGYLPGDVQGHISVGFDAPEVGDVVRVTGYGVVPEDDVRTFSQQTHTGKVANVNAESGVLRHKADTTGGNSGSAVVHEASGEIVGVHSHAGCFSFGGSNRSTLISSNEKLKESVKSCLQWEEENLSF